MYLRGSKHYLKICILGVIIVRSRLDKYEKGKLKLVTDLGNGYFVLDEVIADVGTGCLKISDTSFPYQEKYLPFYFAKPRKNILPK